MGPRLFSVVAMVILRAAAMHAVIYGIAHWRGSGQYCRHGRRP